MKNTPPPYERSNENSPDPVLPAGPGASDITAPTAPSMTLKQWEGSQPHRPLQRVPRMAVAHFYKDCLARPPLWILEPARKRPKIDWVRAFQDAEATRVAADVANETEGS